MSLLQSTLGHAMRTGSLADAYSLSLKGWQARIVALCFYEVITTVVLQFQGQETPGTL
jgi:hypothetical protein